MLKKTNSPFMTAARSVQGFLNKRRIGGVLRFLICAFAVGAILSIFSVKPLDVAVYAMRLLRTVQDMGFLTSLLGIIQMILLGAVLIAPVWAAAWVFRRFFEGGN